MDIYINIFIEYVYNVQ